LVSKYWSRSSYVRQLGNGPREMYSYNEQLIAKFLLLLSLDGESHSVWAKRATVTAEFYNVVLCCAVQAATLQTSAGNQDRLNSEILQLRTRPTMHNVPLKRSRWSSADTMVRLGLWRNVTVHRTRMPHRAVGWRRIGLRLHSALLKPQIINRLYIMNLSLKAVVLTPA